VLSRYLLPISVGFLQFLLRLLWVLIVLSYFWDFLGWLFSNLCSSFRLLGYRLLRVVLLLSSEFLKEWSYYYSDLLFRVALLLYSEFLDFLHCEWPYYLFRVLRLMWYVRPCCKWSYYFIRVSCLLVIVTSGLITFSATCIGCEFRNGYSHWCRYG
jgi:hypothetical protein